MLSKWPHVGGDDRDPAGVDRAQRLDERTGAGPDQGRRSAGRKLLGDTAFDARVLAWSPTITAIGHAYRMTSGDASAISMTQRSRWAFIAASSAAEIVCICIRVEWNEKPANGCGRSSAGNSVSTVAFGLGTTSPIR